MKDLKYKVDQMIVYPLQGVGKITEITERKFKGEMTPYYTIYIDVSDMTVMIPVANTDTIGIRAIISKEKAIETLSNIKLPDGPSTTDWKERYQNNMDKLKTGDVREIAEVVSALYYRSKVKPLPIMERKLYDTALKLLVDELSLALVQTKEDISQQILAKMEED